MIFSVRSMKQTQNHAFTFAPPIFWDTSQKIIKCDWSTWFSSSLTCFAMSVLVSQGLPMTTSAGETGELSVWRCWRWFFVAKQSDWVDFFSQEMASPIGIDLIRRMHIGTLAKEKHRATWVSTQIPCRTISYLQMKYLCTPFRFFHPCTLSCHPCPGGLKAGKSCKKSLKTLYIVVREVAILKKIPSNKPTKTQPGTFTLEATPSNFDQLFGTPRPPAALWNFSRHLTNWPFQRSDVSIACWGWGGCHSRRSQGARTKSRCCPEIFPTVNGGNFRMDGYLEI